MPRRNSYNCLVCWRTGIGEDEYLGLGYYPRPLPGLGQCSTIAKPQEKVVVPVRQDHQTRWTGHRKGRCQTRQYQTLRPFRGTIFKRANQIPDG